MAGQGKKADAIKAFDALANDKSVSQPLRDLAEIRAALLALDTGDLEGAKKRAEPLDVAGNPWRHEAREVLGTAAYKAGDLKSARDYFTQIQQDAQTPPDLWIRSGLMVSLIDGQLAEPTAAPKSGQTAPAGGAGAAASAGTAGTATTESAGAASESPAGGSAASATPQANPNP